MKKILSVAFVSMIALSLLAPGALARGDDVIERGSGNGGGTWKLKLSPDDAGTEVEFEVDRNRTGEDWRVVMKRNGDVFFRGTRTTRGASGSFDVRKVVGASGGDFTARATHIGTDHTCRGSASI
jgi:hypothetical protein